MNLRIVIFGLSITSSWGNGHATTYRALVKALAARGHSITFFERDVSWYQDHRDLPHPSHYRLELYRSLTEVAARFHRTVVEADLVMLGSYVPNGSALAEWITANARGITAFYDIDTPVTLSRLESGSVDYINAALIPRFDLYLSFTGGPILNLIETRYGSPRARALYCAVDPDVHSPVDAPESWQLGYLGTFSEDRQPTLERLLLEPARAMAANRFVVAGPQYPSTIEWPDNLDRIEHLPPAHHPAFYCAQRYTLNVTRADMVATGFAPSVRLFEAAACGTPIISDRWAGIETLFEPGKEILLANDARDVREILVSLPEDKRLEIASSARKRVSRSHTAEQRAKELEDYYRDALRERRLAGPVEAVA